MLWVFDINETTLNLASLDAVFAERFGAASIRDEWFALLIHGALVSAATGRYQDFSDVGAAAFGSLGAARGVEVDDEAVQQLRAGMRSLPAHPDVPDGLSALRGAGHRVVALGNSPRAVIDAQLDAAGLTAFFDATYSAEQVRALKPFRAPYEFVLEQEKTDRAEAVMVAAHGWDIAGAQAVGMRTVFVARPGQSLLPSWPAPDAVVPDFSTLSTCL